MHRNANLGPPIVIEEDSYQLGYETNHRKLGNKTERPFAPPMQAAWDIDYYALPLWISSPPTRHDARTPYSLPQGGIFQRRRGNWGNFDLLIVR